MDFNEEMERFKYLKENFEHLKFADVYTMNLYARERAKIQSNILNCGEELRDRNFHRDEYIFWNRVTEWTDMWLVRRMEDTFRFSFEEWKEIERE